MEVRAKKFFLGSRDFKEIHNINDVYILDKCKKVHKNEKQKSMAIEFLKKI